MSYKSTVCIVDDDVDLRNSMRWMLTQTGYPVEAYDSAEQFLETCDPEKSDCIVLDIQMPGMSGLELQAIINERHWNMPVIIVTGHADVSAAVRAMEAGAMGFIEKPFSRNVLLNRIEKAIAQGDAQCEQTSRRSDAASRLATLTSREREIAGYVAQGMTTKEIATHLCRSEKTIHTHRARIHQKLRLRGTAKITRLVLAEADLHQDRSGGDAFMGRPTSH